MRSSYMLQVFYSVLLFLADLYLRLLKKNLFSYCFLKTIYTLYSLAFLQLV